MMYGPPTGFTGGQPGQQRKPRRALWLSVTAATSLVIAGAVTAAVILTHSPPVSLHRPASLHKPVSVQRPTRIAGPVPSAAPSIITPLPATAGSFSLDPLDESSAVKKFDAVYLQLINLAAGEVGSAVRSHAWAVYQGGTDPVVGGPARVDFLGGTLSTRISNPMLFVTDVEESLSDSGPIPQEVNPESGGGAVSCLPAQQPNIFPNCFWADGSTFGMIVPISSEKWPVALVASLLNAMRPDLETGISHPSQRS
jgi:hypothetical protein